MGWARSDATANDFIVNICLPRRGGETAEKLDFGPLDPPDPGGYKPPPSRAGRLRKKPQKRCWEASLKSLRRATQGQTPQSSASSDAKKGFRVRFLVFVQPCRPHGIDKRGSGNADSQPAHSQAARRQAEAQQGSGPAAVPAKARRLHPRLHHDAEEAELRAAQGRQGAPDQRLRSADLHSRRRP